MVKKVIVILVDDFDGLGVVDEMVEFGFDGVIYEIDFFIKNVMKLCGDLK